MYEPITYARNGLGELHPIDAGAVRQRVRLAARYYHAQDRAARARDQGDRAGSLIAAGDARRIMAAIVAGRTDR